MKRIVLFLLALTATSPALADDEDLLECTTQEVTPAFRGKIADAMLAADSPDSDALFTQLASVADKCLGRFGLAEDKREAYFTYAMARLPHDAFTVRLGNAGIPAAVLDEALDFGPGRTNPVISDGLDSLQTERIVAALEANGVAIDKVQRSVWNLVGAYAAATSLMWQARAKLP